MEAKGENRKSGDYKKESKISEVLDRIDSIYEQGGDDWREKILSCMLELSKAEKEQEEQGNHRKKAGLIDYDVTDSIDTVEEFGISTMDEVAGIHFEKMYKQEGKLSFESLKESFEKLAVEIVEKHPEARAVAGASWLLDTPIAKRYGFHIYKKVKKLNYNSIWLQFIDKDGQINRGRLDEFLKTGEIKHSEAYGIIPVEEYLKKYLPKEKRGEIVLKEIDPEYKEGYKNILKISGQFNAKVDSLTFEEIKHFFDGEPLMVEYFKTKDGKEMMNYFRRMKKDNLSISEMKKKNFDETSKIGSNFREYLDSKKVYLDKKIIID